MISTNRPELEQAVIEAAHALAEKWTTVRRYEAQALIDDVIAKSIALRAASGGTEGEEQHG